VARMSRAPPRVADLEQQMHSLERRLDGLDVQLVQFRDEMRVALSATRHERHALHEESLAALAATKAELLQGQEALREESLAALAATKVELQQGIDETRRYMLVLHEQVIERIKWIREG
jgi:phage shock protein A